jgi:hypothetical protein
MDHYAFLLVSMTLEEAKETLGFLPSDQPSDQQVKDAWKKKVFEAHPDRGGDPDKAVALNVAKDVLDGKQRPTYDRSTPSPPGGGYTPQDAPKTRWEKPKSHKVTFDEAKSKAGIPHAEWQFAAEMKGTSYSTDESSRGDRSYVIYGRTESKHIFVAMRHQTYQTFYVGGDADEDTWTMKVTDYPVRGEEGKTPAWLYGNVVKAFKSVGADGRFNSKVFDLSDKHWVFSEKFPAMGSAVSIKHWLVGSGSVAGDDPSVATRKHIIELNHETDRPYADQGIKPGFFEEPHERWNFWDNTYHGDFHKLTLLVNTRPYDFSAEETKRFLGLKLGGKRILNVIYGDYPRGGKKIVTRLKAAKPLLEWFGTHLQGLPQDAKDALLTAAAAVK